jgi:hypothetical protein
MSDQKPEEALREAVHRAADMGEPQGAATDAAALLGPTKAVVDPEMRGPAASAYARLVAYIQNFESQLDSDHEIAMGFAGSDAGVLKIEGLGYYDPDLITFYGVDDSGAKTQLVQHISQLSVMLRAVPKAAEKPANRIGFRLDTGWQGGGAGDASV